MEEEEEEEEDESTSISSTTSESESVSGSQARTDSKGSKKRKDGKTSDDRGSSSYNDGGDRRDSIDSSDMLEQGRSAKAKQLKEPLLANPQSDPNLKKSPRDNKGLLQARRESLDKYGGGARRGSRDPRGDSKDSKTKVAPADGEHSDLPFPLPSLPFPSCSNNLEVDI
tara:strand:+ start:434 stop:940 length:507 start_codon:yes stop_codon:yes gene_type:complete